MVTEKQRKARARFSKIMKSGGFKKHRRLKSNSTTRRRSKRGEVMARGRKRSYGRRRGGGMNIANLAISAVAGAATSRINDFAPQVIPMQDKVAAAVAGYFVGAKGIKGAIAGTAGAFALDMLAGSGGSSGNVRWYG